MMTVGSMQAVADAIAEAQNTIGGFAQTRVTDAIAVGQTIWPVESVFEWPATGQFLARGTVYSYASRSETAVEGVTWTDGDSVYDGAAILIPQEGLLTDVSKQRSDMDKLRGAILVDRASGSDLDVVGRNVGVDRLPSIPSDDLFREIVKALAYNPRGTIYGMELFLDAALGAGNYAIIEDLIEDPNTVKIQLLAGASLISDFEGKAFLTGSENQNEVTATTLNISDNVITDGVVHGVRFKDENHESDFRTAKPSVETLVEYIGDVGTQLWYYIGASEAADVTVLSNNQGIQISDTSAVAAAWYGHGMRIQPESDSHIAIVTYMDSGSTFSSANTTQWGAQIWDGAKLVAWGVNDNGTDLDVGITDGGTAFVAGVAARLEYDRYYDIELKKWGTDKIQLFVNGALVQEVAYSVITSSVTETQIGFGSFSVPLSGHVGRVKEARYYSRTSTDYWGGRGVSGAVLTANPRDLDVGAGDAIFTGGGVDDNQRKLVYITGGTTLNPQSGTNNGIFVIDTVNSAQNLTLQGVDQTGATVLSSAPTRFVAANRVFRYPDDLGKTIEISGAAIPGNNGSFTITQLIDADDGVTDLDSRDTRHPETTSIAIASAATFVTETGIPWRLDPDFVTESSLIWEVADLGSVSGTLITLRQALPSLLFTSPITASRVLQVAFSEVLSAQILADISVSNVLTAVGPPRVYSHYPFYLSDPLGFVRYYLDLITVAGVIPEFVS